MIRMRATDTGMQTLEFMDQALFQQEIQRAVDCRRRGISDRLPKTIEYVVGADGSTGSANQFQHLAALRGEYCFAMATQRFGMFQYFGKSFLIECHIEPYSANALTGINQRGTFAPDRPAEILSLVK